MFGPLSHALDSFPVVCLIWVFVKISMNFVVKYSEGVTYFLLSVPQPTNTRKFFHVLIQHQLIGEIAKPRATRKALLQFFSPTSSGFCGHPISGFFPALSKILGIIWKTQGQLHWLIMEPTKHQNIENCQQGITLLIFGKNNLISCSIKTWGREWML